MSIDRIVTKASQLDDFAGGLVANSVTYVGTGGSLAQSASLTFDGTTLRAPATILSGAISCPGTSTGTGNERFGAGASVTGTGSNNTAIGAGAVGGSPTSSGNVVIGQGASSTHNSNVVIGQGSSAAAGNNVVIGQGITSPAGQFYGVAIGSALSMSNSATLALGFSATASANSAAAIGWGVDSSTACELAFGSRSLANLQPRLRLMGSTTQFTGRDLCLLASSWVVSTDATRTGRVTLSAFDYGGAREGIRIEGTGTATALGFYGTAAVARQTITGSRASGAALTDLLAKLAATGLFIDGTTT